MKDKNVPTSLLNLLYLQARTIWVEIPPARSQGFPSIIINFEVTNVFQNNEKRKIQPWLEETVKIINITLMGEEIPIDLTKLPLQLKERITVHVKDKSKYNDEYRSALLDKIRGITS